jgi:hypothetical protein
MSYSESLFKVTKLNLSTLILYAHQFDFYFILRYLCISLHLYFCLFTSSVLMLSSTSVDGLNYYHHYVHVRHYYICCILCKCTYFT